MTLCTNPDRPPAVLGFDNLTPAPFRRMRGLISPQIRVTPDVLPVLDPAVMAGLQLVAARSTPRGGMGGRA